MRQAASPEQQHGAVHSQQHQNGDASPAAHPGRQAVDQPVEQGLEHVQEQQSAQSEADGGGESDTALKVDGVVSVGLLGPGTGQGLQQIAGGQLDGGGGDHAAQEHQHRLHPAEPRWLPLSHQAGEGQQEH